MLTTDKNEPLLNEVGSNGQNKAYLVLSEEEKAKGYIRPFRDTYKHVGQRPKYPTRELTEEEIARYSQYGYVLYEEYPEGRAVSGMYWTKKRLKSGCGTTTTMNKSIAETYAVNPKFYEATFCVACSKHFPTEEFVWVPDGGVVGS